MNMINCSNKSYLYFYYVNAVIVELDPQVKRHKGYGSKCVYSGSYIHGFIFGSKFLIDSKNRFHNYLKHETSNIMRIGNPFATLSRPQYCLLLLFLGRKPLLICQILACRPYVCKTLNLHSICHIFKKVRIKMR